MMLKLIKGGTVYAPAYLGKQDILIADGRIAAVEDTIDPEKLTSFMEVTEAEGKLIVPGLVDGHVHITGGGGEGGFSTRTPELTLKDCIDAGVTTVVGVLGTDGTARTMTNLVAKAKGLTEEGITCFCQSGSYHVPVRTLTGSLKNDIMFVEEIIGAGEIAIEDHRSSQPEWQEIARLASEARAGGLLSGKGGVVTIHVGDGKGLLSKLETVVQETEIPITQFWPTHINRHEALLEAGIRFAREGGFVDFTTSTLHPSEKPLLKSSRGMKYMLDAGVPPEQITFTSDGQGSLPQFDENRQFTGLGVGKVESLLKELQDAVLVEGLPLETVWKAASDNPARLLQLQGKGAVEKEKDADLLLLHPETLHLESVMARGRWLQHEDKRQKGTFEEE